MKKIIIVGCYVGAALVLSACKSAGITDAEIVTVPHQEVSLTQLGLDPVEFHSEVYFDFDKAELTPRGKHTLNGVSGMLLMNPEVIVSVTGHSDRLGTDSHNRSLSERRAASVRAYLMKSGIEAYRINASGHGVSRTAKCDQKSRKKLIQCLQPDRNATLMNASR